MSPGKLAPQVYEDLRKLAAAKLASVKASKPIEGRYCDVASRLQKICSSGSVGVLGNDPPRRPGPSL